jgi:hypothetical protein
MIFQSIKHTFDNILSGIGEGVRQHFLCLIRVPELVNKGMPIELDFMGMVPKVEYKNYGFELPADDKTLFVPVFVIVDEQVHVLCSISIMLTHVHFDLDGVSTQVNSGKCGVMWFRYGQNSITHNRFPSRLVFLFGVRKYPVWGKPSIPFVVNGYDLLGVLLLL